jgi:hypothetical protein
MPNPPFCKSMHAQAGSSKYKKGEQNHNLQNPLLAECPQQAKRVGFSKPTFLSTDLLEFCSEPWHRTLDTAF